jgi:hypothetical protein
MAFRSPSREMCGVLLEWATIVSFKIRNQQKQESSTACARFLLALYFDTDDGGNM